MLAVGATLCALVVTLFVALTGTWIPIAVALSYAVSIGFVWRSRLWAPPASHPLEETRRWATKAMAMSVLGLVVASFASMVSAIRPSQAKLAERFRAKRSEYEALREMIQADRPLSVSDCGRSMSRQLFEHNSPEQLGITRERQATYERLLRSAGCPGIGASDGSVRFSLAGWGMANSGWRIGLYWSKTPPQPLVANIDGFVKRGGRSHSDTQYSRIDGDWYLSIVW